MSSAQGEKTCLGPHVFRRQAILTGRAERSESLHDCLEADVLTQEHSRQALDVGFCSTTLSKETQTTEHALHASCQGLASLVPPYKGHGPRGDLSPGFATEEFQSFFSKLCGAQLRGWSKVVAAVRCCSSGETELFVSLGQTSACITANHVLLVRDFRRDQVLDLFGALWRACQG